jgi:hypothetical protein
MLQQDKLVINISAITKWEMKVVSRTEREVHKLWNVMEMRRQRETLTQVPASDAASQTPRHWPS